MVSKPIVVKLKPAAEKAIKQGHPWVWESGIDKLSRQGSCGDTVIIFDKRKNKFLALGLYDPESPIVIKVLQSGVPMRLDTEWLEDKLRQAKAKREPLLQTDTNSYRWIYGENDDLPGLIIDVYDDVAVIKLYSLIWESYLDSIITIITEQISVKAIVLRLSRLTAQKTKDKALHFDGAVVFGKLSDPEIIFTEYSLKFSANVVSGHKTGYFLDHRHNRYQVGKLSKGKRVLDIFSYAGGFSVHALAGGAQEVTSLDISKQALEMAKKNVKLNKLTSRHKTLAVDAFEGMETLYKSGRKFDLIIVDPPSYAKKAEETNRAIKSYKRLTNYALHLVTNGGILVMASCSSRVSKDQFFDAVESTLSDAEIHFEILDKTSHDIDHPIKIKEAAYLKCGYYKIF